MEVFLSALAGALAGSLISILATVVALRAERKTSLTAIRLQDVQAAWSEFPTAFHVWMRSVNHLFGPRGRPGDDELQEVEARYRMRLVSLRHRLPEDFEVGPAIDDLLERYNLWIMSWVTVPEPTSEQLKMPTHLSEAAIEIAEKMPNIAKRLRTQLGEQLP